MTGLSMSVVRTLVRATAVALMVNPIPDKERSLGFIFQHLVAQPVKLR